MKISAVFLDRDGVLNKHLPAEYVKSPDELIVLPGVAAAVRRMNDVGLPVIVISNQQGVGKGLMTEADLQAVEARMEEALLQEAGARIDRCYYCTDLKSAHSLRRKPEPGMLIEAAAAFGLTLRETVFLGDSPTDIAAGHAAGVGAAILLLSGGTRLEGVSAITPPPNFVFADLPTAVDWILDPQRE